MLTPPPRLMLRAPSRTWQFWPSLQTVFGVPRGPAWLLARLCCRCARAAISGCSARASAQQILIATHTRTQQRTQQRNSSSRQQQEEQRAEHSAPRRTVSLANQREQKHVGFTIGSVFLCFHFFPGSFFDDIAPHRCFFLCLSRGPRWMRHIHTTLLRCAASA